MAAGDASIIITAVDRTQAGVASAQASVKGLTSSLGSLQSVIATLGGLSAATFFASWAKDTVAAASEGASDER